MNSIKSFMGRRQFLIAAGMASGSALVIGKQGIAYAADSVTGKSKSGAISTGAPAAGRKYSNLLSPLKIGNVVLRNRMYSTNALPHYLQGPENYCSESIRSYYTNLAKNGAAIVTCRVVMENSRPRKDRHGDSAHMAIYDIDDYGVQNYLDQLAEGIHCYGAKASFAIKVSEPENYVSKNVPAADPSMNSADKWLKEATGGGAPARIQPGEEMSIEMLQKIIDDAVTKIKFYQSHGFDMVCLANTLSTSMRNRTDKYGGASTENQGRFALELYKAIKKACGQDFLIEALIAIKEPSIRQEKLTDYSLEEAIALAKLWEGSCDMFHIRVSGGMANHPTGFNSEKNKPYTLRFAQAIKESGAKIMMAPNGGFQDLDFNEECIATGKADMIAMGHVWITDWDYGKKAYQGRNKDVVPCIMCNKCHGLSTVDQWYSVCSVNPKMGIAPAVRLIDAPAASRKVAVIGGGPAGMQAAITAAERGHNVTLYEKAPALGGLLRHTDYSSIKWPLRDYKDYLIYQVKKMGVNVQLGTEATPEMIRAKGYDAVLAAAGAEPVIPRITGADSGNVMNIVDIFSKEKTLGKNVVFIGGGEMGAEAVIFLVNAGHTVTALTSGKEMVKLNRVHYPEQIIDCLKHLDNFNAVTEAIATRISQGKVSYVDAKGVEKSVQADSVVGYAGLKAKKDEALKFSNTAAQFSIIGDCSDLGGNVQKAIRSAFFAASQI
jgi:2,4-dienoyl-CoA reductase-like NADH-dependent reductase (Old Yellow Enzyme family)/thioredoxin reductase